MLEKIKLDELFVQVQMRKKIYLLEVMLISNYVYLMMDYHQDLILNPRIAPGEILIVNPDAEAVGRNNKLTVAAYYKATGEKITTRELTFNNVIDNDAELSISTMNYDGVIYELADNINPNYFVT